MKSFLKATVSYFALVAALLGATTGQASPVTLAEETAVLRLRYGIAVDDKTDRHAPAVIHNLLLLLEHGLPRSLLRNLRNVKHLFAYRGHDARVDVAAFHPEARAISIGGVRAYGDVTATDARRVSLLAALAHEIDHAFLLQEIRPAELREISTRFGGWTPIFTGEVTDTLMAPVFFRPHPSPRLEGQLLLNLTTEYAATNIHEWFADAFAAVALRRLGEQGFLGPQWPELLVTAPARARDYGVDYTNLSPEFVSWLAERVDMPVYVAAER